MILRLARENELDAAFQCIEDAKEYQRSQGFTQWHDGYPTRALLEEDIRTGIGFVFADDDDTVLGYCVLLIGEEPVYRNLVGEWKTNQPYAVVHRMAFGHHSRGRGLSALAFEQIKEYCLAQGIHAIRIDTQGENVVMQHCIRKAGFEYCGTVDYAGGPKLAYEWDSIEA